MTSTVTGAAGRPRLVWAELRPLGENATLILTPEGQMFAADVPPAVLGPLLHRCDGTRTLAEILEGVPDPESCTAVLEALAATRSLSTGPSLPGEAAWARFDPEGLRPEAIADIHALLLGDPRLLTLARAHRLLPDFVAATVVDQAGLEQALSECDPARALLVVLRDQIDTALLEHADALCERAGVRWVQFHLDGGRGWLGPAVEPGFTASYRDLLARRRCVVGGIANEPETFRALTAAPIAAGALPQALLPETEQVWMLAVFFAEVERWLAGAPCRIVSVELEADPLALELRAYPVLPLPERALAGELRISAPKNTALIQNERSGIVVRTVATSHHPDIPAALTTVQAHVAHMWWHDPIWPNSSAAGGTSFDGAESARLAAVGEAVERYCGNWISGVRARQTSYNELVGAGEHAIDPERLVLFSERLYRAPGFPFVRFTRDLSVSWVRGWSLTHARPTWVPLSLSHIHWRVGRFANDPITHDTFYGGIAAHTDLEQALVRGIEETVERDAMIVWWLNAPRLPALRLPPELAVLWQGRPAEQGQHAWAIALPNQFHLPVVMGAVEHRPDQLLTLGFACRPDPAQAVLKAWGEALTLQDRSRDLHNPDSLIWQEIARGTIINNVKPWRADRAYMDHYRTDFRDVLGACPQQQFFLDPRAVERVRPWIDTPEGVDLAGMPCLPDRSLATYRARIEAHGFEIVYVDLTTPDVAQAGFQAVRVLIPGLAPDFPAAFPHTGGGRIQQAAVSLGWRATPLPEEELNYLPMPHA